MKPIKIFEKLLKENNLSFDSDITKLLEFIELKAMSVKIIDIDLIKSYYIKEYLFYTSDFDIKLELIFNEDNNVKEQLKNSDNYEKIKLKEELITTFTYERL